MGNGGDLRDLNIPDSIFRTLLETGYLRFYLIIEYFGLKDTQSPHYATDFPRDCFNDELCWTNNGRCLFFVMDLVQGLLGEPFILDL